MTTAPEPLVYTVAEAAFALGVQSQTVYRMVRDGQIASVRLRDAIRIPKAEVERILAGTGGERP